MIVNENLYTKMISCPLCCQSQFSSVDLLRTTLINALQGPFMCPICNEIQHGLDNLAAHLSKHIQVPSKRNSHIETNAIDINNAIRSNSIITNEHTNGNQAIYCEMQESPIQSFAAQCANNNLVEFEHVTEKVISSSPALLLLDQNSTLSSNIETETETETSQRQRQNQHQPNNDIVQVFFCHLCACTFRSLELQQMHLQLVHELNVNQIDAAKVNEARNFQLPPDNIDSNTLQCNLCSKRFKMIGSLRLHVRMVHGVSHVSQKMQSPRDNQPDNVANTIVVKPLTGPGGCTADPAGDSIMVTSLDNDDKMQSTHSTNGQMEHCNDNNNYGAANNSFAKDDITKQDAEDSNDGNNCNKDNDAMAQNDDRTHECDICNKRFTTKYFLKKHKRIHTGESALSTIISILNFVFLALLSWFELNLILILIICRNR